VREAVAQDRQSESDSGLRDVQEILRFRRWLGGYAGPPLARAAALDRSMGQVFRDFVGSLPSQTPRGRSRRDANHMRRCSIVRPVDTGVLPKVPHCYRFKRGPSTHSSSLKHPAPQQFQKCGKSLRITFCSLSNFGRCARSTSTHVFSEAFSSSTLTSHLCSCVSEQVGK